MASQGRSTGKSFGGRLRVGEIISAGQQNRGSIPSKFETVLNTGLRERDGFSRRTNRFDDPENDLPGPGAYNNGAQTLVKDTAGAFTSKRGTGGFASTQKRFFEEPRPLFITPGPGNYQANTAPTVTSSKSAAFAKPHTNTRRVAVDLPNPGPGEYYDDKKYGMRATNKNMGASSVFKSSTGRDGFQKGKQAQDADYTDAVLKHKSIAAQAAPILAVGTADGAGRQYYQPATSAVFKSSTARDGTRLANQGQLDPKNLPPCPGVPVKAAGSKNKGLEVTGASATQPRTTANLLIDGINGTLGATAKKDAKPSAVFAPTTLDRFGKSTVKYTQQTVETPGPGYYNSGGKGVNKKLLISSSWAMSGVGRFEKPGAEKWKTPGPAFYTGSTGAGQMAGNVGGKPSYHLNSKQLWV
eukprot:TRINITY_DN23152_c0_g1_i1.p1 TRINITY_DN23152_c0_g1~~TRINITY_DN23152_c0_g1_i1.p1  ORF type:complete len:412 (+),score=30.04 TRINITY_DN23152_c0_g1_i1:40-1275(+)